MAKVVCIADTHYSHRNIQIPVGDVLVHAGDFMASGYDLREVDEVNRWLGKLPHRVKIVVPGNHDWAFELPRSRDEAKDRLSNAVVLIDQAYEWEGLRFYGSPWTLPFFRWAFQKLEPELQRVWQGIPEDLDVLITHSPPYGIGDLASGSRHAGSRVLRSIVEMVKPRFHVFGHLHHGYGVYELSDSDTVFVNASVLDDWLFPSNRPLILEV